MKIIVALKILLRWGLLLEPGRAAGLMETASSPTEVLLLTVITVVTETVMTKPAATTASPAICAEIVKPA
jgi:hypothetical protein